MRKRVVKKGLVIGIIVLFIGVGVVPNIRWNIEKLSNAPDIDGGNKEIKMLKWEIFTPPDQILTFLRGSYIYLYKYMR